MNRGICENCNQEYTNTDRHKICSTCRMKKLYGRIEIKHKDKKCVICNEIFEVIDKTRMRKHCDKCRRFRKLEVRRQSQAKRRVSRTRSVISNQQDCVHCGLKYVAGKTNIHIDHIVPIALVKFLDLPMDAFALENQQPLCKPCHTKKTYIDYGTIAMAKKASKYG